MSDFIQEVDEEYRRDRLMAFLSRYQVLIALAVVAIIGGAGFYRFWADRQVANAEKVNDRFMAADALAKDPKTAGDAVRAFDALATDAPAGYALLARMRSAEVLAASEPERAASAFDVIAGDDKVPASMRDTARLRGALIRIDTLDPKAFEQRYGRFSEPGFAYANSMRELLALAAVRRQDAEAANRYLADIAADPAAPAALRGRAAALQALVAAGPAVPAPRLPAPASVRILGQGGPVAGGPAPGPGASPAAASPDAANPAAATPAAPTPASPAAATVTGAPAPVPPALKPPGNAPPD